MPRFALSHFNWQKKTFYILFKWYKDLHTSLLLPSLLLDLDLTCFFFFLDFSFLAFFLRNFSASRSLKEKKITKNKTFNKSCFKEHNKLEIHSCVLLLLWYVAVCTLKPELWQSDCEFTLFIKIQDLVQLLVKYCWWRMLAGSGIVGMFLDLATAFVRGILPGVGTKRHTKKFYI